MSIVRLLNTESENRGPVGNPREAFAHPQRLSDSAALCGAEATVHTGEPGMLRCDRARSDLLSVGDQKSDLKNGDRKGTRGKRLSDRYLAGMLDADGSVGLAWFPTTRDGARGDDVEMTCYAQVRFDQKKADGEGFIRAVRDSLVPPTAAADDWGKLAQSPSGCWYWRVTGRRAMSVLMRLRKYLVVHRFIADVALEMNGEVLPRAYGQELFAAARQVQPPLPKHPTRPWVAGYLDGNGSVDIRLARGAENSAQVTLTACDEAKDRVGIDLLKKAFGGSVREWVTEKDTQMVTWTLTMPPSKVRAMFGSEGKQGSIAKHGVVRKDLYYFILGCARLGHFRDGERIREGADAVKSQPHRLNDPSVAVGKALSRVRDIPSFMGPNAAERKRQWTQANA